MVARRLSRTTRIEQQIKALRMRVSFLERALHPPGQPAVKLDELARNRKHAEEDARLKALTEYYHQKKVDYYLHNPVALAQDLAREREIADFLRARGIEPEPSRIPKQFHRGLKRLRTDEGSRDR